MASPADAPSSAPGPDAVKARIVAHMNKDHAGELTLYLRAFNGLSASAAARPQLVDMTLAAMTVRTGTTGTTTPHVVAIDHGPQRHVLAGQVAESVGQRRRNLQGDRNRVVGERGDLGYTQPVEAKRLQLTAP